MKIDPAATCVIGLLLVVFAFAVFAILFSFLANERVVGVTEEDVYGCYYERVAREWAGFTTTSSYYRCEYKEVD